MSRMSRWTEIIDRVARVVLRIPNPGVGDHIPHGPTLPGKPHEGPPITAHEDAPHLEDEGRRL